jgi:hypothetical protein
MKQLDFDFDGREPSLRDLMREAGLETSADIAKRQYVARRNRGLRQLTDPLLHMPSVANAFRPYEAHSPRTEVN